MSGHRPRPKRKAREARTEGFAPRESVSGTSAKQAPGRPLRASRRAEGETTVVRTPESERPPSPEGRAAPETDPNRNTGESPRNLIPRGSSLINARFKMINAENAPIYFKQKHGAPKKDCVSPL